MWRSTALAKQVRQNSNLGICRFQCCSRNLSAMMPNHIPNQGSASAFEDMFNYQTTRECSGNDDEGKGRHQERPKMSRKDKKDKISSLINTLSGIDDSKEAVYGALDAWVAWEQTFPIGRLKMALKTLEEEQQWHRAVQVSKWMLSKGQGNTVGTYGQLMRVLDMDQRGEEAHEIWVKKLGRDLHSLPWKVCHIIISVYYRNKKLENLVRLFKALEAFDREPQDKALVEKVANSYEMLGLNEEKEGVLEKYKSLFMEAPIGRSKKSGPSGRASHKNLSKSAEIGERNLQGKRFS